MESTISTSKFVRMFRSCDEQSPIAGRLLTSNFWPQLHEDTSFMRTNVVSSSALNLSLKSSARIKGPASDDENLQCLDNLLTIPTIVLVLRNIGTMLKPARNSEPCAGLSDRNSWFKICRGRCSRHLCTNVVKNRIAFRNHLSGEWGRRRLTFA